MRSCALVNNSKATPHRTDYKSGEAAFRFQCKIKITVSEADVMSILISSSGHSDHPVTSYRTHT